MGAWLMRKDAFELLRNIHCASQNKVSKPHKFSLLLAIIELYDKDPKRPNAFQIDKELELIFELKFRQIAPEIPFSSSMIEIPFYYLQGDGFWHLHIKPGKENKYNEIKYNHNNRFTKKRILEIFSYASLSEEFDCLFREKSSRKLAENILIEAYRSKLTNSDFVNSVCNHALASNQFVQYLNSLQRSGGSNENALAESQACNKHFATIHVPHPLAVIIYEELNRPEGRHVILTGHAGDGKSTIALEVYKRLRDFPSDTPLQLPLKPREDVGAISIIKDLSERDKREDQTLLDELTGGKRRFLLVSNTGTLLDLIKANPERFHASEVSLESMVLNAISSESGEAPLSLGATDVRVRVFNLARMDNLALARKIFTNMLAPKRWEQCGTCEHRNFCPIFLNVSLLRANNYRAVERIFLAYRRMYEYGTRLTIRQFAEHLSYMLTAGLDMADIARFSAPGNGLVLTRHLFFNRFFGDDGGKKDAASQEMLAVQAIEKQGFGERPAPGWEHRLWLHSSGPEFKLGFEAIEDVFAELRRRGARNQDGAVREQVRRILFFLYDFKSEEQNYLSQYLNSPTLLEWYGWQGEEAHLGFGERDNLEQKIYHVLQEHFTGVRLPEGSRQNDRRLYVTLSRRRNEVRQSAQIVLAQVDWSTATVLELRESKNASGERRNDLVLKGKDRIKGVELVLPVPFLDYVMLRHFGELGEVLDASYRQRLERFKAQVHNQAAAADDERIMLVRLRTDHTFRRQHFSVNKGCLEVRDVL